MDFASFFNAVKPAYEIEQSLRFDGGSKLSRTPSSAGSTTTWTLSYWIKIGDVTAEQAILSANPSAGGYTATWFSSGATSRLKINQYNHPTNVYSKCPTPKYRDPSAWFHVVVVYDSTNATADDRVRFYVNGVRQTDFSDDGSSVGGTTNPSQNQASGVNHNAIHYIGSQYDGTYAYAKSYLAEMHLLDGTAVTDALDFGKYDANGVWIPKEYGGTYGTNGFYLKFDPDATNGIGHDHSGNGNNWTASGFVTSGTGTDVMSDTPTKNFCTWNPLDNAGVTISNGNLDTSSGSSGVCTGTFAVSSGKWYWEYSNITTGTGTPFIMGLCQAAGENPSGHSNHKRAALFYTDGSGNGNVWRYENGSVATTITVPSSIRRFYPGDVLNVVYDADAGKVWFGKNGQYLDSSGGFTGNPVAGTNATVTFPDSNIPMTPVRDHAGVAISATANFGQREFAHPPGTTSATDYFNTITWSGDGSNPRSLTGVGFQPDFVWIKRRTGGTNSHHIVDAVRGASLALASDSTDEDFSSQIGSLDSDGFSTNSSAGAATNASGSTYVAWCWKAGGTASSNTDGTLTSSVSVNNDAGFSVCTYTGAGGTSDFGHGLDTAPSVVIVKNRDASANWNVYHSALGNTQYINLNNANSAGSTANMWNNTSPTSSVVHIGTDNTTSGNSFVAYCFAEKPGVSKFGSYTGTGAAGNYVELGFKPAAVILKRSGGSASHWYLYDSERGSDTYVLANSTAAETTNSAERVLFTQSGFLLNTSAAMNTSGAPYIYMAFAENFTASDTYKTLNSANLPAPTVKDGSKYFDTKLFTAGTTTVTGVGHQPDFVWAKNRDQAYNHRLIDVVRGVKNDLYSNNVSNEQTNQSDSLLTFTTDGFTHGKFGSADADDFVAWNWKAGGSVSADNNTDGTITSTVSASPTSGFSIVGWTGTGANGTVGHGLGVAPSAVLVKNRDDNTKGWPFQHTDLGNNYVEINNASSTFTGSTYFQNTAPTSTVFSVGTIGSTNGSGDEMIAYCFAEVDSYSRISSYIGNGSTDGPFIATSFAPAIIIIKKSGAANWVLMDKERYAYNPRTQVIYPNDTSPEVSLSGVADIDFLSNGFKIRRSWDNINASGTTYVFMAFAENPFGGDGVSPATAR